MSIFAKLLRRAPKHPYDSFAECTQKTPLFDTPTGTDPLTGEALVKALAAFIYHRDRNQDTFVDPNITYQLQSFVAVYLPIIAKAVKADPSSRPVWDTRVAAVFAYGSSQNVNFNYVYQRTNEDLIPYLKREGKNTDQIQTALANPELVKAIRKLGVGKPAGECLIDHLQALGLSSAAKTVDAGLQQRADAPAEVNVDPILTQLIASYRAIRTLGLSSEKAQDQIRKTQTENLGQKKLESYLEQVLAKVDETEFASAPSNFGKPFSVGEPSAPVGEIEPPSYEQLEAEGAFNT